MIASILTLNIDICWEPVKKIQESQCNPIIISFPPHEIKQIEIDNT